MEEVKTCYLCGTEFSEWGNNPAPLGPSTEKCCHKCNVLRVIPARIESMQMWQEIEMKYYTTEEGGDSGA